MTLLRKVVMLLSLLLTISCSTNTTKQVSTITLPQDDAYIEGHPIQWWYWSGFLKAENGRHFGFQMVFFSIRPNLLMAHASVTDIDKGVFQYETITRLMVPKQSKQSFQLSSGSQHRIAAEGAGGSDSLSASVENYGFDLTLKATKPPLLYYGGMAHEYSMGGYTYYYSRPKMEVAGTIRIDGIELAVSGEAWFDRQYGDLEDVIDTGWQWFSIRLLNNSQLVLSHFEGQDAASESFLVMYEANGDIKTYSQNEYKLKALDFWRSSESDCSYPIQWQLEVDDHLLTISPYLHDQEVRPKYGGWLTPTYWEGAALVEGDFEGSAYVELHGFCESAID